MVSLDFSQAKTDAEVRQSFRNSPSTMDGFIKRENISFNPKVSGNIDIGVEADYVAGIDLQQIEYDLKIPFFFFGPIATTRKPRVCIFNSTRRSPRQCGQPSD